ncbi:cysteine-tryptophan domain-containing zinc finger protein 7-like isoform X2 [Mangifera indica]|uniref:cysteine-tryptophan domain-containing zinc finger protein 7-like isoform X2 n=1 Tax=Mangifera indica TaxID=29780 RepID=UPI001CFB53C9|nr:cysteine-tryptophan domain-containing zinc finger protein 7-like isoform X2 [Mangifera indica]
MISVGNRDANKELGFGLGLGGGGGRREMEENELEEGEACSYNNNNEDYDASIDPDIALSYIDEKLQHVLGHFQKDFEGGVSAENLGAKFGGYGSFLPTCPRSPVWSHPKTPPKVHYGNASKSPNNMQMENGRHSSVVSLSAPHLLGPGPASSSTSLPALKAPSINDSVKEEVSMASTRAEEYVGRHEFVNKKHLPDQKTLKVRIKVGSDNLLTQKNAAIYSGLGLDVSPSSSLDDSPSESEGNDREHQDAPSSPTHILMVMTSFPVPGGLLLSPLPDYLFHLTEKEKLPKDNRSVPFPRAGLESDHCSLNGSDSRKSDGKVMGEKKAKSVEINDFFAETKSGNNKDARNCFAVVPKREVDIDMQACETLVTETLKLPLLSNSYSTGIDIAKGAGRALDASREPSKRDPLFTVKNEEALEPMYGEETGRDSNPKVSLVGKSWEDKKASTVDDVSSHAKIDGYSKRERTFDLVKADSNVFTGRKGLNNELVDPPKLKTNQRVACHELDGVKLPSGKEHQSSRGKKKSKGSQSHGSVAAEVPKQSLKVSTSSVSKSKKSNHTDNSLPKRITENKLHKDMVKAEDTYREFFGEIAESEQEDKNMSLLETPSEDKQKDFEVAEKGTSTMNNASKERSNGRKIDKVLTQEADTKSAPNAAPLSGSGAVSDVAHATSGPVLIEENWVMCDKCQTWRLLPIGTNPADLPENWLCSMLNWLPGMNRCSFTEEETTKALIAQYQVLPAPESHNNLHINSGCVLSRVNFADVRHPDPNYLNFGSHAPHGGKKKHGLKEIAGVTIKDGHTQSSNSMKKNIRASVRSGILNDMGQPSVVGEPDNQQVSKSSDLPGENHRHKQKEKHKVLDPSSDGGYTKGLKIKSKRDPDHESSRAFKKIRTEGLKTDEDWMSDHGGAPGKDGPSSSDGFPTASAQKDRSRRNDHSSMDSKSDTKDRLQVSAKKAKDKVKVLLDDSAAKKRKMKDSYDNQIYAGSLPTTGNRLQGGKNFVEEFSDNDYRREKKARVSKYEGKESSVSKGSGKTGKKSGHAKNQQQGQDLGSTLSQRSLYGMDNKRDSGPVLPSVAATSSSSKVSGSHKNKASFHEQKGSPVESVSSSPMRISNPDKGTSAGRNLNGKIESHDTEFLAIASPRKCSYDEDEGGSARSGTQRKDKLSVAQHGSLESVLDIQDKDFSHLSDYRCQDTQLPGKPSIVDDFHDEETQNNNQYHANGSHSRKSGKGSSSQSKDKSRSSKSDSLKHEHAPSCEAKPKETRNRFQEKFGVKSDENEKRYIDKKDMDGKLSSETFKRENQSNLGGHDGHDAKLDAPGSQDAVSTPKRSLKQDCNGERSSKTFVSGRTDHSELVPGRGKSLSLPPVGGSQSETPVRCPRPDPGFHKGNGSDSLAADASQVDDTSKLPKHIRKADNQNGHHTSSRHATQNGLRFRDVDAPSPARKDSSSQSATNAVKEAKDLKHMADRMKNSGSNESTGLYFQAALKFLHGASLLESSSSESAKHGEMIQSIKIYSSTAKLCEFCAHEYEKSKDMAAASLAYKLVEVAYMRVIYSSHASASRDRHELQTALQMAHPGESPSSSASDVDNLNHPTTVDKVALPKGVSSPQVAGNHVITAQNRSHFVRLLKFAQDVNFAMEASRKSRNAFAAANGNSGESRHREGISSIKRALDFNFQDVEGLLHLVRVAMEAISR